MVVGAPFLSPSSLVIPAKLVPYLIGERESRSPTCHCEERSDVAISAVYWHHEDSFIVPLPLWERIKVRGIC